MVLDPRPDTETLVEAALELPFETVSGFGNGFGLHPDFTAQGAGETRRGMWRTDISDRRAEMWPRRNATKIRGCADAGTLMQKATGLRTVDGRFDLIVCQPALH